MPRPPILEQVDWKSIFQLGKTFDSWLAESPKDEEKNCEEIRSRVNSIKISPHVMGGMRSIEKQVHVVVFAEAWCGDVVRHVPVLQRLANASACVDVKYLSRDDAPTVFVRFLTNGGEAVPKFVFLSDNWVETGSWGPMPAQHRELIARGKACGDVGSARKRVSELYDSSSNCDYVVKEVCELIDIAASARV